MKKEVCGILKITQNQLKFTYKKAARPTANLFHFFRFLKEIMNSALQLSWF